MTKFYKTLVEASSRLNPLKRKGQGFLSLFWMLLFGSILSVNMAFGQVSTIAVPAGPGQVNVAGFERGKTQQVISTFQITQATSTQTLTQIVATTTGTYQAADIVASGVKLYGGTTNDLNTATLLKSLTAASTGTGETFTFNSLTYSLTVATHFFWITVDVNSSATIGRTIIAGAIANTAFTKITGGTWSGSVTASGTSTIIGANAAYTPGNIVGLIFNSASSTNTTLTLVELNKTTVGQTPTVRNVGNVTGASSVRLGASATSNGYLSNSNDRTLVSTALPVTSVTSANANTITTRGVTTYNNTGTASTFNIATTYTGTSGQQPRSASTLDNTNWFIGEQNGLYTNGASAPTVATNHRAIKVINGTAYVLQSTTASPAVGTYATPTATAVVNLPGLGNVATSPVDFFLVASGNNGAALDIMYMVASGFIFKHSLVAGSWTANGSYTATGYTGGFGMVAEWNGTGTDLFVSTGTGATAANSIIKLVDAAGYNSTINLGALTTLYTAPANTTVKGLAFSPMRGPVIVNSTQVPSSLSGFTYVEGSGPSAQQSFTVSGSNLSNNIVLTPPSNYEISLTNGGSFAATNPITLTPTAGTVASTTIYVRLKGSLLNTNSPFNNNLIAIASTQSLTQYVTLNGTVTLPTPSIDSPTPTSLSGFSTNAGTASANQTFTVGGNGFLDGDLSVAVTSGQYEVSLSSGSGFGSSVSILQATANAGVTTIYVRVPSTATAQISNAGVITFSGGTASNKTMNLSGIVINATSSPTSLSGFSTTQGTASASQSFSLTGQALSPASGNLTIAAPTGFEVSFSVGSGYGASITQAYTLSALSATTIFVRIASTATAGPLTGNVSISGGGLSPARTVALTGTVSGLSITGTVQKFFNNLGTASGAQSVSIAGVGLGANVTVGPFTGYLFGTTSAAVNQASLSFSTTAGVLNSTIIYLALDNSNTAGNYNGNVPVTDGSITSNLAVTGTTLPAPAAFAPGNFVVARVGDGSSALTNFGTETYLDEYTYSSGFVLQQSVALPASNGALGAGNKPFTLSGTATSDGYLNLSPDGKYLTMAGYAVEPRLSGTSVSASSAGVFSRAVASITYDGAINTTTTLGSGAFSGNNVRSAVTLDGSAYWISGAGTVGGVFYAANGASTSTQVANVGSNNGRVINISNGALYVSSQSGANVGINVIKDGSLNTGLFTGGSNTASVVSGLSSSTVPNAYNFVFLDRDATVAGNDLLYVADNSNGLLKFSFDGTTWTSRGSLTGFLQGVTARVNGSNQIEIYATGSSVATGTLANRLYQYIDATAFNASLVSSGSALSSVAAATLSAAANTGFKGVSFTPIDNPTPTVNHIFTTPVSGTIAQGTAKAALLRAEIGSTIGTALLTAVSATATGTFTAADVAGFKLIASTDNVLDGSDLTIGNGAAVGTGGTISFTGLSYTIPVDETRFLFITADVSGCATISATIGATANIAGFTYTSANKNGASGTTTPVRAFVIGTPEDITNLSAPSGFPKVTVSWTNPSCLSDVVIVASTTPITGTPTGTPAFNLDYSLATLTTGLGKVVYRGVSSPQIITGLTLGQQYYFKVFTRFNTAYAPGVQITATPNEVTYYAVASGQVDQAIWSLTPNGSPVTAASLGGFGTAVNLRIRTGRIAQIVNSGVNCNDIIVEGGATLWRNSSSTGSMAYFNVTGDVICTGSIGNGSTFDAIGFNMEGNTHSLSGIGSFNVGRIRKSASAFTTTNVSIDGNVNVLFPGQGAVYNNSDNTRLNITVNAGRTLTISDPTGTIALDGVDGASPGQRGGDIVVNGNLVVEGIITAKNNNTSVAAPTFGTNITVNSGGTINAVTIDSDILAGRGSVFTINSGGKVEMRGTITLASGNLIANGPLVLKSTASATARIGNSAGNISGLVTAERFVPTNGWHLTGTAVGGQTIADWNDDLATQGPMPGVETFNGAFYSSSIFEFDQTYNDPIPFFDFNIYKPNGWKVPTTSDLFANKGYRLFAPAGTTLDNTGTYSTGPKTLTTSLIGSQQYVGYNLFVNPHLSAVNRSGMTFGGGVQNTIIVWDQSSNTYRYEGTAMSGSIAGGPSPIASGQGFFVYTTTNGATVTIPESAKALTNGTFFRTNTTQNALEIQLKNSAGQSDVSLLQFHNDAAAGYDTKYDAYKMMNPEMSLYSILADGGKLANQALPFEGEQMTLPLGFKAPEGSYTLNFSGLDILNEASVVYLKDNETGAIVDLNQNAEYAFVLAQAGQNENRFELIFTNTVTSVNTLKNTASIAIYPNPVSSEKFTVATANMIGKVTIEVLDVLGRKVDSRVFETLKASTEIQINKPTVTGQYSVKVTDAKGFVVKSLIVQ